MRRVTVFCPLSTPPVSRHCVCTHVLCGLSWEKALCSSQRKRSDGRVRVYLTDEPAWAPVGTGVKRVAALVARGLGPSFLPWSEIRLNICRYKRL